VGREVRSGSPGPDRLVRRAARCTCCRPSIPNATVANPSRTSHGASPPDPVEANEGSPLPEFPVDELPLVTTAAGATVVVVVGRRLVVVVLVVEEVVVVEEVGDVVVVELVDVESGVTVQQAVNDVAVPGATATVSGVLAAVAYDHVACTPSDDGELMHEDGKEIPYSFVELSNDTVTPDVDLQRMVEGDPLAYTTPLKVPGEFRLLSASAT
jgi:hypothetical protein